VTRVVEHLHDDYGITARRVAWVAGRLDLIVPQWAAFVDPTLFEHGEIETSPVGQVRSCIVQSDPRWLTLSEILWSEHPVSEAWRPLWRAAWQSETLRRRGPDERGRQQND